MIETTNLPVTFGAALEKHARERPSDIALRFEDRVTDYATFDARANRIANGLAALGLKKGDRVAYVGKNSDQAIELVMGSAKAGCVFVPIIWRLAPPEIDWIMADAAPAAVFVEPMFAERAGAPVAAGAKGFVINGDGAMAGLDDYAAWRDAQSDAPPAVTVDEEDVVLQLYTSGTTGKPKGVMLTHANGIRLRKHLLDANLTWLNAEPGSATVIAMPYGHIGGVGVTLGAVNSGQEMVVHAEFDPGAMLDAIERYRLKRIFMVPAALGIMLAHPKATDCDFGSIESFSYGASPIPLDLLRRGVEVMGCDFVQVYGMTETWGSIVALPPEDHKEDRAHKMTAAGKAMPGVELRILDADGNDAPTGTIGEVAIKSPSNMKGYWNRPEETEKTLIGDGWLRTGDAGILDDEGYLFIQDRIKDMIITGAENVYPAEVESAIYGHPHVADVAVIGVPDPKWGEAVKAIVVPHPGIEPDSDAIIAHARAKIAGFKCPKSIDFIDALPRNPSGKILRRELRSPYWAGRDRQVN